LRSTPAPVEDSKIEDMLARRFPRSEKATDGTALCMDEE
jgi:hypothetical protein